MCIYYLLIQLAILSCVSVVTFGIKKEPRIFTRNGHLSVSVDKDKHINFLVSGEGRIKVNDQDIVKIINSLKNVSNLIDNLSKPSLTPGSSKDIPANSFIPVDPNFTQRFDILEQAFNNHTYIEKMQITRMKRRLNVMQRNYWKTMAALSNDECSSNPCSNGGTCQDLYNRFQCFCPDNWEGVTCEKDVNECAIFAGTDLGCQNGASCVNKIGSYECICTAGFHGMHCTTKSVDCYTAGKDLCGHGTCVPQASGYKCFCDQGWTTDGKNPACNADVNECESHTLWCSKNPVVACINVPGSFYCGYCPAGYSGNGYYCNDIDECQVFNGGCSMNPEVQCINTPGSRTCGLCPPGYVGNGVVCTYQGSVCTVNNGGCHLSAQCRDNPRISSSYVECICPRGYTGNGIGPNGCVRSSTGSDPCNPNPCVFGTCSVNNQTGDYVCFCRRKYTGRNCDMKKDPCLSNPCQNGGTCLDSFGISYRCNCPPQYTGNNCQSEKQTCGGNLEGFGGSLQFPLDSNQQNNHAVSCAWVIETNSSKILNITFTKFDLEDSDECQYDWVQIHDGRNSAAHKIGKFCGSKLPKGGNIVTTTNLVYIWFRSNNRLAKAGFSLNWTTIDLVCGGIISATSDGTIQTPGYPGNYPLNRDCYWKLTADRTKRIEFHFLTLMIGQDTNCTGDYLEFYYDSVKTDHRFAQFCTTTHPAPLTSPSHNVIVYFHSNDKLSYSGFQISYKVVPGIPSCGGTFTTASGQITSPIVEFSTLDLQYLDCEYKISVANQLRINIKFNSIKLYKNGVYCAEHVRLYDGPTVESPLIGKYCGDTTPPSFLSTGNEVLIKYYGRHQDGFTLKYDTVCGIHFTAPTGVIMSPNYPNASETFIECVYTIFQSPGIAITLTLYDIFCRNMIEEETHSAVIEVRDGNSKEAPLLKPYYVFTSVPNSVSSTHNYLTLTVMASPFGKLRYYLNYTAFEVGCGGVFIENFGTIRSPNYPGLYPNKANCKWVIQAPANHVVQLNFVSFDLETSDFCYYDYVKIYDVNDQNDENEGVMGKFCGSRLPPTLVSASNSIMMIFKTDLIHIREGFLASYIFIPEENTCGGTYFTNAGVIKSPKYPKHYPINRDCKWVIHVEPGRQIMLNITDVDLEWYSICKYDFLEIRNGASSASPLIVKYCDTTIPKIITSHANQLFVHLKTGFLGSARGVFLSWSSASTGCGGLLTSPTGTIISPQYPQPYSKNTECYWKILINAGSVIQIIFTDFDLESHRSCDLDYIEIYDGKDFTDKLLGRLCNSYPPFLRSTSNNMFIKFRSDVNFQGRGFQIQYTTICNNTLSGFNGVVESPNFPNRYPQNKECTWILGVAEGNKIEVTFSHFELERSISSCNYHYVELIYTEYDAYDSTKKIFCGEQLPPKLIINSNTTKVHHFVSDHLRFYNGFRLEWRIIGCGGLQIRPEGEFSSPNYPNHYPPSTRCDWVIKASYGNSIAVTFDKVDLQPNPKCTNDVIQIYNGPNDQAHLMNEICHITKPIIITSSGNSMLVRFQSNSEYEYTGFKASYKFVPSKCGGILSTAYGEFTSPNYPKNYDVGSKCRWVIEVEQHHVIELKFNDVDLAMMLGRNYIKVFDGPSENYPLLVQLAGDETPNATYRSTYNRMYVIMETAIYIFRTAKGFKASYVTACGAILDSDTSGVIDYIKDPSVDSETCEWTIISPDLSKKISLSIQHIRAFEDECPSDISRINIYNGFNSSAPKIGSYCLVLPPMITSTGSMIHISTKIGFRATYTTLSTVCGGSLEGEPGYFVTPNYPGNYPVDIECEWTVNISDSIRTVLSFSSFNLVDSEHCNDDFLEIREDDRSGRLLGIYCGDDVPVNVTAVGNIWIYFKSSKPAVGDNTVTAKGFEAEYYLAKHTDLYGSSGSIYSPLYPNLYTKSKHFTWRITTKLGHKINLYIKDLNRAHMTNTNLCYRWITIHDGYDTHAFSYKACDLTLVKSFTSTSNVLYIDANIEISFWGVKFHFDWESTNTEEVRCGGKEIININALGNYTITSPGFPLGYDNYLDCEWIFTTIPENHLQIDFHKVDLENPFLGTCLSDRVEIYTGVNGVEDWKLLAKICMPNDTLRDIIKTSNLMKVVFKTDSYQNRTGFTSTVVEGCGGSVQKTNGIIEVTEATSSNSIGLNCQWNVSVRTGRVMKINFELFDIGQNLDSKCNNYILLRNGQTASSPLLGAGKYCDSDPPSLQTISNHLFIKFSAKSKVYGFKMRYDEVNVNCDGRLTLSNPDDTTNISSPNFPNIPLPHMECTWLISAPPGQSIQIDFVDRFDLTDSPNCDEEYVEVRDGATVTSPLIGRFCESMPSTITTEDNMAFIKFYTDVEEPRKGFKAKIGVAKCGGTIRSTTGEIKFKYFNSEINYRRSANCSWEIKVPDGHSISFTAEKIDLPRKFFGQCEIDYVEILEHGVFDYSNLTRIAKVCITFPGEIKSTGNMVLVRFVKVSTKDQASEFWLKFTSSQEKCGGRLEGDFGFITSPGYPVIHPIKCQWTIKVTKGRRIQIEILDLDFDTTEPSQSLAFSNAKYLIGHITLVKAGDKVKYINSTDNTMSIFFWTISPSNHRGFKLKYTSDEATVCLGDFSLRSGRITSPQNVSYYYCTWNRIEADTTPRTFALELTSNANEKAGSLPGVCMSSSGYLIVTADSEDMKLGQICNTHGNRKTIRNPYFKTDLLANLLNSNFSFTVDYQIHNCGGIIKGQTGNITSPGFPKRTSNTTECAWLIELPEEQTIKLKFDNLELGNDCSKSFVIVYNGKLNTSPRLGKYCGNTYPQILQSQSNHLWIEYHSETSDGKGFNSTYEAISTGCGGVFHDTTRIIQSPAYPDDYPNNAECIWEVRAEEGYHIGLQFFDRFHIEKSEGCVNDYVEVLDYKNDVWSSLGRICGREYSNPFNSSSTQMKIVFRTNDKTAGAGFKARWSLNCGGNFTATRDTQYIKSPGNPNNDVADLNCLYNIVAPRRYITLKFEQFALGQGSADCRYDNVTITYKKYEREMTNAYCGDNFPPVANTMDLISIRFKADTFMGNNFFVFSFATDDCGQDIYTPMEIESPRLPPDKYHNGYTQFHNCIWRIFAPKDKVVAVKIVKLDTRGSSFCYSNYISLYDGYNISANNRLAKLCGNLSNRVSVIKSTNNGMVIEYRSFHITSVFKVYVYFTYGVNVGCGGIVTLDTVNSKNIETPNLEGAVDCQWVVQAPNDYYINIEVVNLPVCQEDNLNLTRKLEIINGASHFSELIVDLCNHIETAKMFSTSIPLAFIHWSTLNNKGGRDKFKLKFSVAKSKCGVTTLVATESVQYLTSPNFPDSYPANIKCVWRINTKLSNQPLSLKVVSFDLGQNDDPNEKCVGDRLDIAESENRKVIEEGLGSESIYYLGRKGPVPMFLIDPPGVHSYCGATATEFHYYSGHGKVIISFTAGGVKHGKGFKLEYATAKVCRNHTSVQGRLYTNNATDCDTIITTPPNTTMSLYFEHFGIHTADNCSNYIMEIYDGDSTRNELLAKFCENLVPISVFSTTNKLLIRTRRLAPFSFCYYDMIYTSTTEGRGCGGKIYNYRGVFTSPLYPNNFKNISHCTWDVIVPYNLRVGLKFTVFDIKAACHTDYVTVTTYLDNRPNVQKYCQCDNIPTFESINRIKVEYITSFNNGASGWVARFKAFTEDTTIEW